MRTIVFPFLIFSYHTSAGARREVVTNTSYDDILVSLLPQVLSWRDETLQNNSLLVCGSGQDRGKFSYLGYFEVFSAAGSYLNLRKVKQSRPDIWKLSARFSSTVSEDGGEGGGGGDQSLLHGQVLHLDLLPGL